MNCPRCNEPVEPGAVFCGNCGQSLQQAAAPQPMARPAANFGPPPSRAAPSGPMTRASFSDIAPARPAAPSAPQPQQPFGPPQSAPAEPVQEVQEAQKDSATAAPVAQSSPAPVAAPFGPSAGDGYKPSPVAAALHNAAATPGPTPVLAAGQPALGGAGAAAVPGYAVADPAQHKAETKAIIGLVASILSLSGVLVPFLGILLAIVGVVFASIARSGLRKKLLATLAFVFAGIGVAVSIAAYVHYYQAIKKEQASASTTTGQTASSQTDAAAVGAEEDSAVDNPCFSMTATGMTDVDATSNVCKVEASDGKKSTTAKNALIVESLTQSSANASNLAQLGQAMTDNYIKSSIPGLTISSQKTGTFAASPAYLIHGSKDGIAMDMGLVLHPTAHGENLFLVITTSQDDQGVSISKFEKDWKWK